MSEDYFSAEAVARRWAANSPNPRVMDSFTYRPSDPVNKPSHYTQGKVECIDAIESALGREGFIAFLRGQVLKYTWRLTHKGNPAQDAAKAKWYGDRLAALLEEK